MAGDIKEGRPLIYKNKEELQKAIDEYFEECKKHKSNIILKGMDTQIEIDDPLIPTIAGLAYHLNIDRQTVYNYKNRDEYFDTITRARDYIISRIETKCVNSDGNISGTLFIAQNYGYATKQEIEQKNINVNQNIDYSNLTEEEAKKLYEQFHK